jgi:putative hydrolase of the HAD superfamily
VYSRSRGYDVAPFTQFFQTEWSDFVTGKKDLKQHIEDNPDLWKWDKGADELLDYWFTSENVKNEQLIRVVRDVRKFGTKCYIATEQEQYRTDYIRDVMFPHDFDGVFSTAEIGYKKNDPRFFESIIKALNVPGSEIIFFDDSQSKIDAARSLGIQAHLYKSGEQVFAILSV